MTFEDAASVFLDPSAMTYADPDHSVTEVREITIEHTEIGRLLFVSHTERAGRIRIIGVLSHAERTETT